MCILWKRGRMSSSINEETKAEFYMNLLQDGWALQGAGMTEICQVLLLENDARACCVLKNLKQWPNAMPVPGNVAAA